MGRKKSEIIVKNADAVLETDSIWIYGQWLKIKRLHRRNIHPFQFIEFYFDEFKEPIRVPAGWKIETLQTTDVNSL